MKFIIFLAFLTLSKGAPTPSEDDVVNKPIGLDVVHIPDEPEKEDIISHGKPIPYGAKPEGILPDDGPVKEDIISHEVKKPVLDGEDFRLPHIPGKNVLGHDGHGIHHTTSKPEGHLHGGIFCATETPDEPKDESLLGGFGHTIVPPFVDPDLVRGKLPGEVKIADIIKEHSKKIKEP